MLMDKWENYFADEGDIARIPQIEVCEFVTNLEKKFTQVMAHPKRSTLLAGGSREQDSQLRPQSRI
jgi:hypothetical protein